MFTRDQLLTKPDALRDDWLVHDRRLVLPRHAGGRRSQSLPRVSTAETRDRLRQLPRQSIYKRPAPRSWCRPGL
ncbi:hypothetical protein ACRAWD_01430 [Caulobacter segnis]